MTDPRMTTPDAPVTVEQYARGLLGEECCEVGQMLGKWQRFGPDHARHDGLTARRGVALECGDVLAAIDYAVAAGIIDPMVMAEQHRKKLARLTDPNAVDDEGRRLAPDVGLAALASAPAGDGVEEGEPLGWLVEWTVAGQDWVEAFACEVNAVDKARAKNGKCTPLYPALARPRAAVGEREWSGVVATAPCQSADEMDEDGNPCWYIEIQSVGGHSIVATIWGSSPEQVQARTDAILTLQSPPAKVE